MHFTNSISLVFLGFAILALYSYPSLLPSRKMAEESPKSIYDFTVKVMFNLLPSFSLFAVWLVRKREKVENRGQSFKLLLFCYGFVDVLCVNSLLELLTFIEYLLVLNLAEHHWYGALQIEFCSPGLRYGHLT
jgi:hypothetical protein